MIQKNQELAQSQFSASMAIIGFEGIPGENRIVFMEVNLQKDTIKGTKQRLLEYAKAKGVTGSLMVGSGSESLVGGWDNKTPLTHIGIKNKQIYPGFLEPSFPI